MSVQEDVCSVAKDLSTNCNLILRVFSRKALFEKMNDCLRHSPSRLDTLTLLGHIVRKQVMLGRKFNM